MLITPMPTPTGCTSTALICGASAVVESTSCSRGAVTSSGPRGTRSTADTSPTEDPRSSRRGTYRAAAASGQAVERADSRLAPAWIVEVVALQIGLDHRHGP